MDGLLVYPLLRHGRKRYNPKCPLARTACLAGYIYAALGLFFTEVRKDAKVKLFFGVLGVLVFYGGFLIQGEAREG